MSDTHWNEIYATKRDADTSWYEELPVALNIVLRWTSPSDPVVDVGAGRSTLLDQLRVRGYQDLTAVDISTQALAEQTSRGFVTIEADVTTWEPARTWRVWHDRAVVHFLTSAEDRSAYVATALRAVEPGGHLVLSTFAVDGPEQCSGLPVHRYDVESLVALFGSGVQLIDAGATTHTTPWNSTQSFIWVVLERTT